MNIFVGCFGNIIYFERYSGDWNIKKDINGFEFVNIQVAYYNFSLFDGLEKNSTN